MKRKIIVALSVISAIFFIGSLGNLVLLNNIDKQSYENTTEFEATVSEVEITDTNKNIYIEIYTEEHENSLSISSLVSEKIDVIDMHNLEKGQVIYFRIENIMVEEFENSGHGSLVSLKTNEKEIFSLDDYNEYVHDSVVAAKKAAIAVSIMFLLISLLLALKLKKTKRNSIKR